MKWITALSLDQWADTIQAKSSFPGLVADLIRASAAHISSYRFPTDDKGQVRGFDGNLVAKGAPPFVPDGESIWEFGVTKDYEGKANSDFNTRVTAVDPEKRRNTTFVFVTPRTWNKVNRQLVDWLQEKRDLNEWKAVEFIDGSMLENWLDSHPAVAARYARQVLRTTPPSGALSTDEFWEEFSTRFSRPLIEEVLLCGREQLAEELLNQLSEPRGRAGFAADSPDEVIAFAVAAIRKADPARRFLLESRAIVVDSLEAVRHLSTLDGLIFLPRGQARSAVGRLAIKGMTVVTAGADDVPGAQVPLPRPSMSALGKAFSGMGYTEAEGYELARKCGRSLAVLARLEPSGARERPEWMNLGPELMPALLAGAWNASTPADRAIVMAIGGTQNYDAFETPLRQLTILKDPPLDKVDDVWKLRASVDAFVNLGHLIGQMHLERLKAAAKEVFGKVIPPPKPDDLFRPPRSQDELHSSWLREGLMTTLLHIATLHSQARLTIPGMTPQQFVDDIVRELPGLSADYRLLASLQDNLPLLAEAAPDPFLEALERLLEGGSDALRPIFAEGSSMFSPRSAHVALVWSLEVLAWDPAFLGRVSMVLARLAEIDPGGSLSNRPINTLRSIFLSWCPNTRASSRQRIAALRHIVKNVPAISWELLVKLLPKVSDTSDVTRKPTIRESDDPNSEKLTYGIVWENQNAIVEMAVQLAENDPERLIKLISSFSQFRPEPYQLSLEAIERYLEDPDANERTLVWNALSKEAKRQSKFANTDWSIKGAALAKMEAIVERFKPLESMQSSTWLFDEWMPQVSESSEGEIDLEAIQDARAASLKAIYTKDGVQGIMTVYRAAKQPNSVAEALHLLTLPMHELQALLVMAHKSEMEGFVSAISSVGLGRFDGTWLGAIQEIVDAENLPPGSIAAFFLNAPDSPKTWEQVQHFGHSVTSAYWTSKHPFVFTGPTDNLLFAMKQYIDAGRPMAALKAAHQRLSIVPTSMLLHLLDIAVDEINATGGDGTMTIFYIEQVFTELDNRPEVTTEEIATRELAYLPCFDHRDKPLALHRLMVSSPETYMSAICAVFKPSTAQMPELSKAEQRMASSAYRLLGKLTVLPGQEGETLDFAPLLKWCARVRELAVEFDRADITDIYIGHLLAHAPSSDKDNAWPHLAVRKLLEELQSEEVENGIIIERHNMRGVFTRSIDEGGAQERVLEKQALVWADAMPEFPRASAMLRNLAESWGHSAKQADLRAEQSALRY